jgi:ABC-type dipeptide/oligopeptide/nickel transport system permease component
MVGLVVVYSVLLLLLNLATDVAYRWLDPRIRHA